MPPRKRGSPRPDQYAQDVLSGAVAAGKLVRLACDRQARDLGRQNANDFPYYFDAEAAALAVEFVEAFCRHSKGEWAGTQVALEPWQKFVLAVIFGWKRAKDGLRRYKTAYLEVARKNGKSTLLAAIGLYLLVADNEPGAEVYSAATKKDQARIIFDEAVRMVGASPELKTLVRSFRNNMHVLETHSKFEPLSADEHSLDGLNIHGGLIDELHAHKTRAVYDVLETATGSRRQPLIFNITTAGVAFPNSICLELRNYGEKVLAGILDDESFFAAVFTIDEGDDWTDPAVWVKANPNIGVSVKEDDLVSKCRKAKETPSAQNNFKTKHLNVWVNSRSKWVPVERWDACREDFDLQELQGRECYAGLDLSTTTDISALVLVFPWGEGVYRVLPFFWVPKENADLRARRDRVPYPQWIKDGHIDATEGNVIDYDGVRLTIRELAKVYKIKELAADPWNATQILQQLQEQDGFQVYEMRQGFVSMSAPMKQLEVLVTSGRLRHDGNPVLRWMFDNVSVKTDPAGNIKPDKDKSAERIDGVVGLIMGIDRAVLRKTEVNPYADGGVFAV